MSTTTDACGLAAETKVETPEGPMTIRTVAGKPIPVLSLNQEGAILFRMVTNARKLAEQQPVLKVTLETGHSFRVAPSQVFLTDAMARVAATSLAAGVRLKPAFHYPRGYHYRTDAGEEVESPCSLQVAAVEPGGNADIYSFGVHQTGCFFLTAGVLCEAEGSGV